MEASKLNQILEQHKFWIDGRGGKRANLEGANLKDANLYGADLYGADLRDANLEGADLFVGHAGGASVHEAMAAGRTMVSVNAATAEERANERFLLRAEGGRASLAEDVGRVFEELVATDALARLGANGRRATLVHAARSVVEQAITPFWHAVRSAAA